MAQRQLIVLGDSTSHGGTVISATSRYTINGKPVAQVGDKCSCPIPYHGMETIVEGDPDYILDGKALAYEGCKTDKGATLIPSQKLASTPGGGSAGGGGGSSSGGSGSSSGGSGSGASYPSQTAMAKREEVKHALTLMEEKTEPSTLPSGVLVIYGRGGKLGNLKVYADTYKTDLLQRFEEKEIHFANVIRRDAFFSELEKFGKTHKIKELHIFSHSYGCGLSFGYEDPALNTNRTEAWKKFAPRIPYLEVLKAEAGILFTDDLLRTPYKEKREKIKSYFCEGAKSKIWGCSSGVANHIFQDEVTPGVYTSDPNARGAYYWRALNEQHSPKPSIAKALSSYFGVSVWGATSGSHVEVFYQGDWITSNDYQKTYGVWPPPNLPSRLTPDHGDYQEFK